MGSQRKEGEWICLFWLVKGMGDLACHRKNEAVKAAFGSEVARNNTAEHFCFPTPMGLFPVGFLREAARVCQLALMRLGV